MTREEILKDPEVAHYCDAKRGWVHEAFMDGVDYAERKMGSTIYWQTGEPKENGSYLVSIKGKFSEYTTCAIYNIVTGWCHWKKEKITAWCKPSNIEPYKEGNNG